MNLLPGNYYLLFTFLVFQGFLVLVVFYFFIERLYTSRKRLHEEALIKQKAYEEADAVLKKTMQDSHQLLEQAHKKASEIVTSSTTEVEMFKKDFSELLKRLEEKYEKRFNDIAENFVKGFNESVQQEKISSLAAFDKTLADVRAGVAESVVLHRDSINKSIEDLNQTLRSALETDVAQARERLSKYEDESKNRIKEKVFSILSDVSYEILGHGVSLSDKEDFILRLIDQGDIDKKFN